MDTKLTQNKNKRTSKRTVYIVALVLIATTLIFFNSLFGRYGDLMPIRDIFTKEYTESYSFEVYVTNSTFIPVWNLQIEDLPEEQKSYHIRDLLKGDFVIYFNSRFLDKPVSNVKNLPETLQEQIKLFSNSPYHFIFANGERVETSIPKVIGSDLEGNTLLISYPSDTIENLSKTWSRHKTQAITYFSVLAGLILLGAIVGTLFLIHLLKDNDMDLLARIWTEAYLVFGMFLLSNFSILGLRNLFGIGLYEIAFVLFGAGLIRKLKMRTLYSHSLLRHGVEVLKKLTSYNSLTSVEKLSVREKIVLAVLCMWIFTTLLFAPRALSVPFILFGGITIGLYYLYQKGNEELYENINKDYEKTLEEKMKSEAMKVELITNVSHDLKTPITAIISYGDLLLQESLSPTAMDYVQIINTKANQLSSIISDVFELSKTTTGNAEVTLETLRFNSLVEQTLADLQDEIQNSASPVKVSLPEEPMTIISDGNRLNRVLKNIMENALKYSLDGTRIFVQMEDDEKYVHLKVINTANYEMTFDKEDITTRFVRGDSSRSQPGSGLGLSIAESFAAISGGKLTIDVLGDQFCATLTFKKSI